MIWCYVNADPLEGHHASVDNLLLVDDSRLISSCNRNSIDHTVKVWDINNGKLLHSLEGHYAGVDNLLFVENNRLISSCKSSRHKSWRPYYIRIWNIDNGDLLHSLAAHLLGVDNLLLTKDHHLISSCSNLNEVKVWDIEKGILLHDLKGHTAGVDNLLLPDDNHLISSCSSGILDHDHTVKVWDIKQGTLLHSLDDHISGIRFMALLPMSGYLMTSEGPRLFIWKLDEGRRVAGFTADAPITSYAITSDDTIILGDDLGWVHFLRLAGPGV